MMQADMPPIHYEQVYLRHLDGHSIDERDPPNEEADEEEEEEFLFYLARNGELLVG